MANKSVKRLFLIPGLVLVIILIAGYYYLTLPAGTPEIAIKKYVFLKGNPIEAFQLQIKPTDIYNDRNGQQFIVRGYYDNDNELVEIPYFWVRKYDEGWEVTSAGTGP